MDSESILAFLSTGKGSRHLTWNSRGRCYRDTYHLRCVLTPLLSSASISRNNTKFHAYFTWDFIGIFTSGYSNVALLRSEGKKFKSKTPTYFWPVLAAIHFYGYFLLYSWESAGCAVLTLIHRGYLSERSGSSKLRRVTLETNNSRCSGLAQLCRRWWSVSLCLSSPQLSLPAHPKTC